MQGAISVPSHEQCLALLSKYKMLENIVAHSIAVSRIAVFIAEKINARGETASERYTSRIRQRSGGNVNVPLVRAAALLHDIDKLFLPDSARKLPSSSQLKISHAEKGEVHGELSRIILEREGYKEVGRIASKHPLHIILKKGALSTIEEKIVFYADKRVMHDKIVPLGERLKDLRKAYPQYINSINRAEPFVKNLESELMEMAGLRADEIK